MFTRCPACHTLFRIAPKQLKAARGQVRCGSCQAVFDALESLVNREELSKEELSALSRTKEAASPQWQLPFDELPQESKAISTEMAAEIAVPTAAESAVRGEDPPAGAATPPTQPATEVAQDEALSITEEAVPQTGPSPTASAAAELEAQSEPTAADKPVTKIKWTPRYTLSGHQPAAPAPRTANRLGWGLGSLLMIAVLAGQLVWFNRDTLALDPRWRPWLQGVCDMAGCHLPPLRDPRAIEMVDRNVQSHPQYQGALLITATLVNQAPFAQPYPQVELAMTDLDQKRIAARRFLPAEYLDNGNAQGLFAPGASVRLKLEIADPGQEAVGFEFEFY